MSVARTYMVTVRFHLKTDWTATETADLVKGWIDGQVDASRVDDVQVTAYEDVLIKEPFGS